MQLSREQKYSFFKQGKSVGNSKCFWGKILVENWTYLRIYDVWELTPLINYFDTKTNNLSTSTFSRYRSFKTTSKTSDIKELNKEERGNQKEMESSESSWQLLNNYLI